MLIYPYKAGSKSAKALAAELGCLRIRHKGSKLKGSARKVVINWGASELPDEVMKCTILNPPLNVATASNKLKFFSRIKEYNEGDAVYATVRIPEFTTEELVVEGWLLEGKAAVARQKLTGNSGEGIVMINNAEDMVRAPLYTQYVKKKQEYRVHILDGKVIDRQRKARNRDIEDEDVNWQVRNYANGFIFQRNDFVMPVDVEKQALAAMLALELDFGAVDVVFNEKEQQAYVLEVNTAPGLEGTTLDTYTTAFKNV